MWNTIAAPALAFLTGAIGYYFGLKTKKPMVLVDRFIWEDKKTCLVFKNVGDSTALNVMVDNISLPLSETLFNAFPQIKDGTVLFRFEPVDHLSPHEEKESKCTLTFNDDKTPGDKEISSAGLNLLSVYLKKEKEIRMRYRDGFGLRYSTKSILNKDRVITK